MPSQDSESLFVRFAPAIFVVLWATGFIGAKYGLPYAEPFTFLALRMAIVVAILVPVAMLFGGPRPSWALLGHSAVAGVLVHTIYLGGVFFAISRGMSAGVSALVVALQPLVTAFIARAMLGERLRPIQIVGLAGGLVGVALVVSPRLAGGIGIDGITPVTLGAVALSVVGISLGAVYQKKFVTGIDLRHATAAQYVGALIPLALLSWATETRTVVWHPDFIFALAWLVFVLSLGAVGLLMALIRRNSAARTASLFYLVPAVTALIAWLLFDETLQWVQLAGMGIIIAAVAAATRAPRT